MEKMDQMMEKCPECSGTGMISAQNCSKCDGAGEIMIHSHKHRHGHSAHDHPHPHGEPHDPYDRSEHVHQHE